MLILTSKKYVKVTECSFSDTRFHSKCQNLQMPPLHFYASSYRLSDIKCLRFYFQKVGQGHRVNFRDQICHRTVSVRKLYSVILTSFVKVKNENFYYVENSESYHKHVRLLSISGILASFQISKVQMTTKLYLQICLHLYGTSRPILVFGFFFVDMRWRCCTAFLLAGSLTQKMAQVVAFTFVQKCTLSCV